MDHFDVLIAGAGPVGATLALALQDRGRTVALVGPTDRDATADTDTPNRDSNPTIRPVALSHASRAFLLSVGAIAADAGTAIRSIHVSQRGAFGRTLMQAADHGLEALGYVYDGATLERTIAAAAARSRRLAKVISWSATSDRVEVRLEAEHVVRDVRTHLLVLAEGGANGTAETVRDYGQSALVGTVRTTEPHRHAAWERFTPTGPLALLPLHDRYAFVWALPHESAQIRMKEDDSSFCAALQTTFGDRVGRFFQPSRRACVSLALKRTDSISEAGVIAIGNAAQALHPVAGQGLNLGLRDVIELAEMIGVAPNADLGSLDFARAFARCRWIDRSATIAATDLFVRAFSNDRPDISMLRGAALGMLDVFPPARRFLARRMMLGVRAVP